jgi:hypothetical protein
MRLGPRAARLPRPRRCNYSRSAIPTAVNQPDADPASKRRFPTDETDGLSSLAIESTPIGVFKRRQIRWRMARRPTRFSRRPLARRCQEIHRPDNLRFRIHADRAIMISPQPAPLFLISRLQDGQRSPSRVACSRMPLLSTSWIERPRIEAEIWPGRHDNPSPSEVEYKFNSCRLGTD